MKKFTSFQSLIKLQRIVFLHVKNEESDRRTCSYEKSSSKSVLLVAVAP